MTTTKIVDRRLPFAGYTPMTGVCRLRIFDRGTEEPPIVVVNELAENTNTSVTNMAENLAAAVLLTFMPARIIEPVPFLWVEIYDDPPGVPSVSYVRFERYQPAYRFMGGMRRPFLGRATWFAAPEWEVRELIGEDLRPPPVERPGAVR